MTENHPITPPPELVQQWWEDTHGAFYEFEAITALAAQWGADQELEACVEWFRQQGYDISVHKDLRAARRPSLKEQALEILGYPRDVWGQLDVETVRRALEQLPDQTSSFL